jgi:hypothetical protein
VTRFAGYCKTKPEFSAIATVAQIFLRTRQFTDSLSDALTDAPTSNLLAIYLDLLLQLRVSTRGIDIDPLIHDYRPRPVRLFPYLQNFLEELDIVLEIGNPFRSAVISSQSGEKPLILKLTPGKPMVDAREVVGLSKVLFVDTRDCDSGPFEIGTEKYEVYVVVYERRSHEYGLYVRDREGWLSIFGCEIVPVDSPVYEKVCLIGLLNSKEKVGEAFRKRLELKPYSVTIHEFRPASMTMKSESFDFGSKAKCTLLYQTMLSKYSERNCFVFFDYDDKKQFFQEFPEDHKFKRSLAMYCEVRDVPTENCWPMLKEYAKSRQIEIPVNGTKVTFHELQMVRDLKDFCRRIDPSAAMNVKRAGRTLNDNERLSSLAAGVVVSITPGETQRPTSSTRSPQSPPAGGSQMRSPRTSEKARTPDVDVKRGAELVDSPDHRDRIGSSASPTNARPVDSLSVSQTPSSGKFADSDLQPSSRASDLPALPSPGLPLLTASSIGSSPGEVCASAACSTEASKIVQTPTSPRSSQMVIELMVVSAFLPFKHGRVQFSLPGTGTINDLITKVEKMHGGEFGIFVVRADKLSVQQVDPSQSVSAFHRPSGLWAYPRHSDILSVAVLKREGLVCRPTGTVFQMAVQIPGDLVGSTPKLSDTVSRLCEKPVKNIFVHRKDGRNIRAEECARESLYCICLVIDP